MHQKTTKIFIKKKKSQNKLLLLDVNKQWVVQILCTKNILIL